MSWQAIKKARSQSAAPNGEPLGPSERHVLLLLSTYYDESEGAAWPSIERMATETGYTQRRIQQLLHNLEEKGVLHREGNGGRRKTNRYSFSFDCQNPEAGFDEIEENHEADFTETGNGEIYDIKTVKSAAGNPEASFTRNKREPKGGKGSSPSPSVVPSELPTETAMPPDMAGFIRTLSPLPGFHTSREFIAKVEEKYSHLDLTEEAIKMASWLKAKPKRQCSPAFMLNWLSKASAPRQGNSSHSPPRAAPTPMILTSETVKALSYRLEEDDP